MKLTEILSMISAPKGLISILEGIKQDEFTAPPHQHGIGAAMSVAEEYIALRTKQKSECKSDMAYWSILGDLVHWRTVKKILIGAQLVGENNMPDVKLDAGETIVMDAIAKLEGFGERVLAECVRRYLRNAEQ